MKSTASNLTSYSFIMDIAGQILNFRVLKMENSSFIYIGKKDEEVLSGLALGIKLPHQSSESISTSILENSEDSQEIAQKLSARLNKPVFVSYNANVDRLMFPLVEKQLIQEIKERPECF